MITRSNALQTCATVLCATAAATALAACTASSKKPTHAPAKATSGPPLGKLPGNITPLHYELELNVDPSQPHFPGRVAIRARLEEQTQKIWMHADRIELKRARLELADGTVIAGKFQTVADDGVSFMELPGPVPPQEVVVHLDYVGKFDERLEGLYRVKEGEAWYAFTQFEAISARLAFPCFDEPRFKTPFDVAIIAPDTNHVAGNTPVVRTDQVRRGWKRWQFATTKPLPTYLIAFAVGPFDVVEAAAIPANAARKDPLPLRGLAVAGKGKELRYALEHTGAMLESLERYFDLAYPFEKLDIVAVPDFAAGAMENVGLITFREYLLLLDENAPADQRRRFFYVMAHELAHQWFGNLVTMPWWDDIWLNEAFASWLEFRVINEVAPDLNPWVELTNDTLRVMGADSLVTARQIREPIESNHDIHNAFDGITYSKGAGVLSMFERYLGDEAFRAGIRHYLRKHSYGTADYEQFLAALSEGSERDITAAFRSFLTQPGVPYLEVTPSCDSGSGSLHVTQSRFFPVGSSGDPAATWLIPMCVRYEVNGKVNDECHLLEQREQTVQLAGGCPGWVMPNADAVGYYRWSLPSEHLAPLRDRGIEDLSARDLLGLSDSLRAGFARAKVPVADMLALIRQLAPHEERTVATSLMGVVRFVRERLVTEAQRSEVEAFGREVFGPALERLGLEPKSANELTEQRLFRRDLVDFMANVGRDPELRTTLANKGASFVDNPKSLDVNLAETALAVAIEDGNTKLADRLMAALPAERDSLQRGRYLHALSRATEPALAQRVRDLSLSDQLRSNEVMGVLYGQMSQPANREGTWNFVTDRYDTLAEKIPEFHVGRLPWLGASFCSETERDRVRTFFESRVADLSGGPRNLAGSLEAINLCRARVAAHGEAARTYFSTGGSAQK